MRWRRGALVRSRAMFSLTLVFLMAGPIHASYADAISARPFVQGLGQVTDFAFLPDGRLAITEKGGALKIRRTDGTVKVAARFQVDDRSEKGLLGVAVDPQFASTHRLFLYESAADEAGGTNVDRHRVLSAVLREDDTLDRSAEKVLVKGLRGPANHDGGGLAFGPDGKLYIGVGDTGCNSNLPPEPTYTPTNFFATCLTNANGKILRINSDGSIPEDNPLVAVAQATACGDTCKTAMGSATGKPRPESWAWGFRNPWRFFFDPKTGSLWVGDVGEITYEEIDIAQKGRHHGWPWREATFGWPRSKCRSIVPDTGECVEPIYTCKHGAAGNGVDGDCQSITAGVIVDGCQWPASWRGRYLFADNANSRLWTLKVNANRTGIEPKSRREIGRLDDGLPVSIHLGPDGDVYIAVFPGNEGKILRLSPKHPEPCAAPSR